jgi:glycine cleavage system H protein
MEKQCPFLRTQKVIFCKAFPVRKMLPYDQLCLEDNICMKAEHRTCPVYRGDKVKPDTDQPSTQKRCPSLEVDEVIFCGIYPVKKMIPSSAFKLECPCTTKAYSECPTYRQIAEGDLASGTVDTVRGFLLEDKAYYHQCHLWLHRINGKVRLGLDDFGQWLLGDIEKINFPPRKGRVERQRPFLRISGAHGTAEIASPLSGTVLDVNEGARRDVSAISADPYGKGWLVELIPAKDEIDRLKHRGDGFFHAPDARRWLEDEVDRLHKVLETDIGVTMSDGGQLTRNLPDTITKKQWDLIIKSFLERKEE